MFDAWGQTAELSQRSLPKNHRHLSRYCRRIAALYYITITKPRICFHIPPNQLQITKQKISLLILKLEESDELCWDHLVCDYHSQMFEYNCSDYSTWRSKHNQLSFSLLVIQCVIIPTLILRVFSRRFKSEVALTPMCNARYAFQLSFEFMLWNAVNG